MAETFDPERALRNAGGPAVLRHYVAAFLDRSGPAMERIRADASRESPADLQWSLRRLRHDLVDLAAADSLLDLVDEIARSAGDPEKAASLRTMIPALDAKLHSLCAELRRFLEPGGSE